MADLVVSLDSRQITIPLTDGWTGGILINVFHGKLSRRQHRLNQEIVVCAKCNSGEHVVVVGTVTGSSDHAG